MSGCHSRVELFQMILRGEFVLGFRSSFFTLPCRHFDLYAPNQGGGYTRRGLIVQALWNTGAIH